jgi:hypothetical protein
MGSLRRKEQTMKTLTEIIPILSSLWEKGNQIVRISIATIIAWPLLVMGTVMLNADPQIVGIVTLLPLIAAVTLALLETDPLLVIIAGNIETPVKWYRKISLVVGLELMNGLVLCVPDVAAFFRVYAVIIILVLATTSFVLFGIGWALQRTIGWIMALILIATAVALLNSTGVFEKISHAISNTTPSAPTTMPASFTPPMAQRTANEEWVSRPSRPIENDIANSPSSLNSSSNPAETTSQEEIPAPSAEPNNAPSARPKIIPIPASPTWYYPTARSPLHVEHPAWYRTHVGHPMLVRTRSGMMGVIVSPYPPVAIAARPVMVVHYVHHYAHVSHHYGRQQQTRSYPVR